MQQFGTKRQWGDKRDPSVTKVKIDGHSLVIESFDAWDGPVEPGGFGQYFRCFHLKDKRYE